MMYGRSSSSSCEVDTEPEPELVRVVDPRTTTALYLSGPSSSSSRAPSPAPRSPTSRTTPSLPSPPSSPPSPPSSSATASAPRDPTCKPALPPSRPHTSPRPSRDCLPPALRIPLCAPPPGAPASPAPPSYPTHALAIGLPVSKSSPSAVDAPHAVFAVHAVILATHCAKLPHLPPASPPSSRSSSITLPVLPLALPSPQAFAILHAYMYTHRIDAALGAPCPSCPRPVGGAGGLATPSTRHALSAHLLAAAGTSLSALMAHVGHVKELWQDMVVLGVYDTALWAAVDPRVGRSCWARRTSACSRL
ncbi:hypothetical protein B0H14DRAFT_3469092 [Mycena olivaceomarginata]|nr:hypothetical protein B0H14DRAFT_3469092 [Mycena olivaceomarginata]